MPAEEAQAVVAAHNAVRVEVGAPALTWDATVARYAQNHVQTLLAACTLAHSSGGPYGENLAAWTGGGDAPKAVTMWHGEKSAYQGGGGPYQGIGDGAGHYTQVVWPDFDTSYSRDRRGPLAQ